MQIDDFDFELPSELIAQYPLTKRSNSRLLVLNRTNNSINHLKFKELPKLLNPNDLLENQYFEILWRKGKLNWIIGKPAIALEYFLKAKTTSDLMKDNVKASQCDVCINIVNLYLEAKQLPFL